MIIWTSFNFKFSISFMLTLIIFLFPFVHIHFLEKKSKKEGRFKIQNLSSSKTKIKWLTKKLSTLPQVSRITCRGFHGEASSGCYRNSSVQLVSPALRAYFWDLLWLCSLLPWSMGRGNMRLSIPMMQPSLQKLLLENTNVKIKSRTLIFFV